MNHGLATPFTQGAIVRYTAPLSREECQRVGMLPSHPVLICTANHQHSGDAQIQCMTLTSKNEMYPGYRIDLNCPPYGESIISCKNMYTIDTRYLGSIIAFASPKMMEKVLKAYSWHIGLSDEMPEYITEVTEIEVNIPHKIIDCVVNHRDISAAEDTRVPVYTGKIVSKEPEPSVVVPEPKSEPKNDVGPATSHIPEPLPTSDIEFLKQFRQRPTSIFEHIESYRHYGDAKISEDSSRLEEAMDNTERFRAYVTDLGAVGLGFEYNMSCIVADGAITLSNYNLWCQKNELIASLKDHSIDMRFIPDDKRLAARILSIADIAQVRMGANKYLEIMNTLGVNDEETLIGYIRNANSKLRN